MKEYKNILVLGLGISGVSTAKALDSLGLKFSIYDGKKKEDLSTDLSELENLEFKGYFNEEPGDLGSFDLAIKTPGMPLDLEIIGKLKELDIEVISDLEFAYRLGLTDNLIVITGTNGKTTTTALTGEIFKEASEDVSVVGNIGVGILWELVKGDRDRVFVIEASSFQLESTRCLKPKISAILNISPDHLNWHGSFENYYQAKLKASINQDEKDFVVLNYGDPYLNKLQLDSKILYFSMNDMPENGSWYDGTSLYFVKDKLREKIVDRKDIQIVGDHNIENILAAISISKAYGLSNDFIKRAIENFKGVPHRIEYVAEVRGVKYYNDSKGTNVDASIKAIDAIGKNIVLIAGGKDKGSDFDEFIESFKGRVKDLILLGETGEKLRQTALNHGFTNIHMVDNMEEAVSKGAFISKEGDVVLLSPACASWDMYPSFEVRGDDFKRNVESL